MSIKLKNLGEIIVDLSIPGTQSAAADKKVFIVPFACQLKAMYAKLGTAGTTGNQIVDVNKNGTTIWAGSTKLTFASTVAAATYDTPTANPTQFAKGDIITVDVDSVHTTPAVNLALLLVLQRKKAGGPVGAMITDGLGPESDVL